jgi:hypothetical protein
LRFFWKSYGSPFHLFGGHAPIMRPFLMLSLGPLFLSILLWFIQTLILWWNKSEEKFDVDSSPFTSSDGLVENSSSTS